MTPPGILPPEGRRKSRLRLSLDYRPILAKHESTEFMNSIIRSLLLALFLLTPLRVVLAQGTNHDYAKWEKEISAFERSDATNPPPKGACLFVGSSTIRLWKSLAHDFPSQQVINRGFGGSEIADSTHFADRIIVPYAPRLIFLRAGGNDLAAGKTVEQVFADFKDFVTTVHAKLPKADMVYISWSPSIARWYQHDKEKELNNLAQNFISGKPWLHYIETYPIVFGPDAKPRPDLFVADKLHFDALGYEFLAEQVRSQWPVIHEKK